MNDWVPVLILIYACPAIILFFAGMIDTVVEFEEKKYDEAYYSARYTMICLIWPLWVLYLTLYGMYVVIMLILGKDVKKHV